MLRKTNGSSSFRTTKLRSFVSTGSSTGVYLKKKKKKDINHGLHKFFITNLQTLEELN